MKRINTKSYFVTIYEVNNQKIVRRKKRKGLHAYPRTMSLMNINKILKQTSLNFPKLYFNGINYVYEEFISSSKNINDISNERLMDYVIEHITNLYKLDFNTKITWENNSEFLKFQIENLKKVLNKKKIKFELNELNKLYKELDNTRNLCFIHGDIHKENMIINDKFYLIDWELATYGDLAYELAIHFILMGYSDGEKKTFIDKLAKKINIDIEKILDDIEVYTKFEKYRKFILKNGRI